MARVVDSSKVEGKRLNRSIGGDIGIFLFLALVAAFCLLPMILAVVNAFKPLDEMFVFPPRLYVLRPTLENFNTLFQQLGNMWVPFSRYFFNTVYIAVAGTIGHVILASIAAYPLSKHNFVGKNGINRLIQYSLMFTSAAVGIPGYIIMAKLGLINTHWSLLLPPLGSTLGLFLMTSFMGQIPNERLEAAKIDGASEIKTFWYIVLPGVRAAWMTLVIFSFQALWGASGGNYIFDEQLKLLPIALNQIIAVGIARVGVGAAAQLFLMIPPIVLFIIVQKNVLETMAHSGVKG